MDKGRGFVFVGEAPRGASHTYMRPACGIDDDAIPGAPPFRNGRFTNCGASPKRGRPYGTLCGINNGQPRGVVPAARETRTVPGAKNTALHAAVFHPSTFDAACGMLLPSSTPGEERTMIGFDTLKAMESLRESGFEETQARAVVDTFKDAVGGSVATKIDLQEVKGELQTEIQEVKSELRAEIQEVKGELQAEIQEVRTELQEVKGELQVEIKAVESGLRAEIQEVKGDLRAEIQALRGDVETSIARLEARSQKFSFGLAVGAVGLNVTLTFGLLKLFFSP